MPKELKPSEPRNPFFNRAVVSVLIFLCVVFLFGSFWAVSLLVPDGKSELQGAKLPPRNTLLEIQGQVVNIEYSVGSRQRQFTRPIVAYKVADTSYRIGTINVYSPDLQPFKTDQPAIILYTPAEPKTAWIKWEYERLLDEFNTPMVGDILKTGISFLALGAIGLTGLLLLINLFVPLTGFIKWKTR